MEKIFYTLEEAAQRLGKSVEQVREMAKNGQLQEFRDRDKLMFKREQVDLISGGGGDDDMIPLADSGELEPIGLSSSASGTGIPLVSRDEKDSTGISIFETEDTDDSDPSAVTRVSNSPSSLVDPGEDVSGKSGSGGLLDLTREGDDTSLGPSLLDDVYGSETIAQQTSVEPAQGGDGGGLFEESTSGGGGELAAAGAGGGVMMVAVEAYDGAGSGLIGGLAIGIIVSTLIAVFTVIVGLTTTHGGGLLSSIGDNFMILLGVMLGVTVLGGIIGLVLGKRS
jgi:excisionase family DNA binding protein